MTPLDAQARAMLEAINGVKKSYPQKENLSWREGYWDGANDCFEKAKQAALAVPDDSFEVDCPECHGFGSRPTFKDGKWIRELCPRCHGRKSLTVREVRP